MEKLQPTAEQPHSTETSEYDTFKDGLRQILSVPKAVIDEREAEWRKDQQQKNTRKKKAEAI